MLTNVCCTNSRLACVPGMKGHVSCRAAVRMSMSHLEESIAYPLEVVPQQTPGAASAYAMSQH